MFKNNFFVLLAVLIAFSVSAQIKLFSTEYRFVNDDSCPIMLVDTWGKALSDSRSFNKSYQIAHEVENKTGKRVISWEAKAIILDKYNKHLYTLILMGDDPIDVADDEIIRSTFNNCGAWQCEMATSAYVFITHVVLDDRTEWNYNFDSTYKKLTEDFSLALNKKSLFTYVEKNRGLHKKYLKLDQENQEDDLALLPRNFKSFKLMMSLNEINNEISKTYPESLQRIYTPVTNSFNWYYELFFIDKDNIKGYINDLEITPSKLHLNKIEFSSTPSMKVFKSNQFSPAELKTVENRNLHGLTTVISTTYFTRGSIDGMKSALIKRYGEPTDVVDIRKSEPTYPVSLLFADDVTAISVQLSQGSAAEYYAVENSSDAKAILTLLKTRDFGETLRRTKTRNYLLQYPIPFNVTKVQIELCTLKREEKNTQEEIDLDF